MKHSGGISISFIKLILSSTQNTNGFNEDTASCKQIISFVHERINRIPINKLLIFLRALRFQP